MGRLSISKRETYLTYFEKFNEAILVIEAEKIMWGNSQVLKLFGYDSLDEINGSHILDHIHNDSIIEIIGAMNAPRVPGINTSILVKIMKKDGDPLLINAKGTWVETLEKTCLVIVLRPVKMIHRDLVRVQTGGLQHELFTSLAVVNGYLEILLDKEKYCKDEELKGVLGLIQITVNVSREH